MDLKDISQEDVQVDDDGKVSFASDGTTSSSSSSSTFPKFREKVPYCALWTTEEGEVDAGFSPQSHTVQEIKESKSKRWRVRMIPDEVRRYWMSRYDFLRASQIVEEVLGMDLMELIKDDPASAERAIIFSAKHYTSDKTPSTSRRCGVCGTEINFIEDPHEEVRNRLVCTTHSVTELKEANLIR